MAIFLKLEHTEGLRLRQQTAHSVVRTDDEVTNPENGKKYDPSQLTGTVIAGKNWAFEKDPATGRDAEVPRDVDPRKQTPLNTYSATISYGLRNLVIEKRGKVEHVTFRNAAVRNQLRIKYQHLTPTGKKNKSGEDIKQWEPGTTSYVAPGQFGGVAVGDGIRAILDEMPT